MVSTKLLLTLLLTLVMVGGVLRETVSAQELHSQPQPRDFLLKEIGFGWEGAILGGIFGYVFFTPILQLVRPTCPEGLAGLDDPGCKLSRLIGTAIGSSLGAGWFLSLAGKKFGVKGNEIGAFLGAALGSFMGVMISEPSSVYVWVIGAAIMVGAPTGIMAALGYNLGATMELKMLSVSPSGLELMSARLSW